MRHCTSIHGCNVKCQSMLKVMSNPVDVAKTRLMNQKAEEGKPLSLGM